jgi:serine-type D-Ala-D-Ala carboxypeptidase/endopeptidase (penicillin-binding protein 4)
MADAFFLASRSTGKWHSVLSTLKRRTVDRRRSQIPRKLSSGRIMIFLCLYTVLIGTACIAPPPSNVNSTDNGSNASPTVSASIDVSPTPTPTPPIAAENAEFDAEAWFTGCCEAGTEHAVIVATMEPGRTLARVAPNAVINPASLVKLATSLVALKDLGADHRFSVDVYADGSLRKDGVYKGDLYFSGSDPVFTDDSSAAVAKALTDLGIKRVDGKVFVSSDFSYDFNELPAESAKLLARNLGFRKAPQAEVADKVSGILLFTFRSQPLHRILLYLNTFSSNFVAHRVGQEIGGVDRIKRHLVDELKLPAEEVKLETTSGLGDNGMTATGIFAVIRELERELRRQGREPVDILPIATEKTSTLSRRLSESEFEGAIVGKTGTLSARDGGPGIAILAGIAYQKNGGPIIFVLMSDGRDVSKHKTMHDDLLKLVLDGNADPMPFEVALPRDLLQTSETRVESRSALKKDEK